MRVSVCLICEYGYAMIMGVLISMERFTLKYMSHTHLAEYSKSP